MRDLLHAVVTEGTGRAASLAEGGKSGSNGNRDAWFVGYRGLVTGVWVGNDDSSDMKRASVGGRMPARVWQAFYKGLNTPLAEASSLDDVIETSSSSALPTGNLPPPSDADMESDRNIDELIDQLIPASN